MTSPRASTVEEEGAEREEVEARLEAGPGLLLETGFTFRIWGGQVIRGQRVERVICVTVCGGVNRVWSVGLCTVYTVCS